MSAVVLLMSEIKCAKIRMGKLQQQVFLLKPGTTVSGILIPKRKDGVTVTERQKKFAEYYAQCGNAAQSAIQAGYSKKYANTNASKLLQNTTITEYIKQLTEDAQTARIMTARERQAILSDIAKDAQNELSDRIRAIDTLNKMTGEYVAKIQAEVKTSEKLSDVFAQIGGEGLDE